MFRQIASKQTRLASKRFQSTASKLEGLAHDAPNPAKAAEFKSHQEAVVDHSAKTTALWKKISFLVAFPVIGLTAVNTYFVEAEHAEHREHAKHLSDDEWPTQYPYQNIRKKNFFWGDGDKTLFWNTDVNRHIVKD
ncbi:unnamed protein product [Ambrosiozyma monospora]|uniref:Cytochrome c oxidase subunit n=1 Tax=Ambrosiozyma monospora TaxID=43982 RepID=A0A9W6YXG7_AMBMO|nr:unnamed protein product [Ambrosiozyma monospora]